ncbi:MAG TPA: hypothetical protein VKA04_10760 [Pseudodesulfovibrio sp.]|nr:hypothetical protein [Pseudodesulfovibrio sp.]
MIWSVKNVTVIIVCIAIAGWFFRYQYDTKTIKDASCVERINRFTGDRCLFSVDVPICAKIVPSPPCER